ncbi:MAG TPA: hypothetical protein VGH28_18285 [Polyangiaceae bacterium]|jgi:hypothetical protein
MSRRAVEGAARTALERWLEQSERCEALGRAIRRKQKDIRAAVSPQIWDVVLALEEQINTRHLAVVSAAIRIAVAKALAAPKPPRRSAKRRRTSRGRSML